MTVVVSDSFNRANNAATLGSADTGQAWSALSGTWGISANQAYNAVVGGSKWAVVDAGVSDCIVQVTLVTAGTDFGLILRAVDNNNLYRLFPESGSIQLGRYLAGNFAVVGTVGTGLTFAANGVLEVDMSGPSFAISYNGVELGTLTSSNFATATQHGFGVGAPQSVKFDNFSVSTADTGTDASAPLVGAGATAGAGAIAASGAAAAPVAGAALGTGAGLITPTANATSSLLGAGVTLGASAVVPTGGASATLTGAALAAGAGLVRSAGDATAPMVGAGATLGAGLLLAGTVPLNTLQFGALVAVAPAVQLAAPDAVSAAVQLGAPQLVPPSVTLGPPTLN